MAFIHFLSIYGFVCILNYFMSCDIYFLNNKKFNAKVHTNVWAGVILGDAFSLSAVAVATTLCTHNLFVLWFYVQFSDIDILMGGSFSTMIGFKIL